MAHYAQKLRLYEEFARVAKALASPARIEVLDLLAQAEKTVEALAEACELAVKNTSAHLRVLRAARLVETRRDGTYIYYRLADSSVIALVRELQALARSRLAEADRAARAYLRDRAGLEPISAKELRERVRNGDAVVLDVRPSDEYQAGHLPGALSIPLHELKKRLRELPAGREVVAYCRGPYCVYAVEAVDILQRAGFDARRTDVGVPDWKLLGNKVEV
jgi:rhodanese-related sulfurtransferase/DNA-binding transcriptional ArsR family regulator